MTNFPCMPNFCDRRVPFHYTTALNALNRMGIDIDRVNILAVGEYENYKGEVIEQEPNPGEPIRYNTRISLRVGFPSPVDYLPYQFFYGLQGVKPSRGGNWEIRARNIMAPFDAARVRSEARARSAILTFGLLIIEADQVRRLLDLYEFDICNGTDDISRLLIWNSLMPAFHRWAGNAEFLGELVSYLFGCDCSIVENVPQDYEIPEDLQTRLGEAYSRLGVDMVVGASFNESDSTYEMTLAGIEEDEIGSFLPAGSRRAEIESIIRYTMPDYLDCQLRVIGSRKRARLGSSGCLGYSSYL